VLTTRGAASLAIGRDCAYIGFKFLVGMTKSGSTRSRSFLLPAFARGQHERNRRQLYQAMTASSAKAVSANRLELLQIADAVAREKSIDKQIVLDAMEDAIQKARAALRQETDITPRSTRDRRDASCSATRWWSRRSRTTANQISLEDARRAIPAPDRRHIADKLPPIDFGRIAAQNAKQVIVQKVREAERDRQYDEYKDRIGEIVNGVVKRVEYGNVIVDLGRGEAIIRRDEMIPRENLPHRRPRPRLYLRRAPRAARPADFPVAHASAVHGQAVRAGSAGNL
jgi:hypothetical protein